jgi:flavodoxin
MKALIICESVHHGNTKKVAEAFAGVLNATVKKPGEVDPAALAQYDLIGFGSDHPAFIFLQGQVHHEGIDTEWVRRE